MKVMAYRIVPNPFGKETPRFGDEEQINYYKAICEKNPNVKKAKIVYEGTCPHCGNLSHYHLTWVRCIKDIAVRPKRRGPYTCKQCQLLFKLPIPEDPKKAFNY